MLKANLVDLLGIDERFEIQHDWFLAIPPIDDECSRAICTNRITSIQKLGAITLTARLGDHDLAPETFRKPGEHTFERDIPADWMKLDGNRFAFALDKWLPPTPQDPRALGIVVVAASLEAR